jgi:hypothetical protein
LGGDRKQRLWFDGQVSEWGKQMKAIGADVERPGSARGPRRPYPVGGSFTTEAEMREFFGWTAEQLEAAPVHGFPLLTWQDRGLFAEPRLVRMAPRTEVAAWLDFLRELVPGFAREAAVPNAS